MKLKKNEAESDLIQIMNKINYAPELYVEENYDIPLTGDTMFWSEFDMIFLVMELIEKYGIRFQKEDFENYRFNNINNIIDIICNKEIIY